MNCPTERFQDGVCLQDLLLNPRGDVGRDRAEVLQDELGALGLAGPGLAGDHQALVGAVALERLTIRIFVSVWLKWSGKLPVGFCRMPQPVRTRGG